MKSQMLLHSCIFFFSIALLLSLAVPAKPAAAQEAPSLPGQFAYVEDGTRLVMIRGDLEQPVLLLQAEGGLGIENPHFSNDGRYLAYCLHNLQAEDMPALYYLDTSSLEKSLVTENGSCSYDWSPDGRTLIFSAPAFLEFSSTLENGIWSYSRATGETQLVIPSEVPVIDPRWSPDGHTISYFDFCFECVGQFYTYDLDTAETKAWSPDNSEQTIGPDVDWSPDGSQLAYDKALWMYTAEGETYGLETATSDGSTRTEILSQPGRAAYFPIWSPDGEQIAFASYESFTIGNFINRRGDLMTTAPDGSSLKTIYSSFYEIFPQAWSPDGRYVLFVEPLSVPSDAFQRQQLVLLDVEQEILVWKISSLNYLTADWAPVPRPEEAATDTPEPSPTTAPNAALTAENEEGVTGGNSTREPPSTESSVTSNLQNEVTRGANWIMLLSICLCAGAVVAILAMLIYLWNWSRKFRRITPPPAQETAVEAQPAATTEPTLGPSQEEVESAFRQGVDHVHTGKVEEGIAELRKVIAAQPQNNAAWFWLGIASVRQKDHRSAERCFLQAKKYGHAEADKALEWLKKQQ